MEGKAEQIDRFTSVELLDTVWAILSDNEVGFVPRGWIEHVEHRCLGQCLHGGLIVGIVFPAL
jgi:hypothetical protein